MRFPKEHPQEYLAKLNALHREVVGWVRPLGIHTIGHDVQLREEAFGTYVAPGLALYLNSEPLADLKPMGAAIIGAAGRVDFIGPVDSATVVYLEKGGPRVTITETVGTHSDSSSGPMLSLKIDRAGWYWIEDRGSKKAVPLTRDLFLTLLSGVSDHAFAQSA